MNRPRAVSADPVLGYPRADGRVGIRNVVAVVCLAEGAGAVADAIAAGQQDVHLIGFPGGHPSTGAGRMLEALCTHPNVGAVVLVSPGRHGEDGERLAAAVAASGRPVTTLAIQQLGGTRAAVTRGRGWVAEVRSGSVAARTVPVHLTDLVVGTICRGSDRTTGITANPVVGRVLDRLVAAGGTAIRTPGPYLLDVAPEGVPRRGFPTIDDDAELVELIAAGAHVVLLTTGRGAVVGPAISPVVKICANPVTFRRMSDDMDVDAGRILAGRDGIDDVAEEVLGVLYAVAAGRPTASEGRGHREFVLTYRSSEPADPSCLPLAR